MKPLPQTKLLQGFWEDYALNGKRREDAPSPKGKEAVLARLIMLAEYVCYRPPKEIHKKNR